MTARGHVIKTTLTPEEKLRVAWAHLVLGIDQHTLTAMYGVNQGRINEAVDVVAFAVDWPGRAIKEERVAQVIKNHTTVEEPL